MCACMQCVTKLSFRAQSQCAVRFVAHVLALDVPNFRTETLSEIGRQGLEKNASRKIT